MQLLEGRFSEDEEPPFRRADVIEESVRVYARAHKERDEVIHSSLYDNVRTRVNFAVKLRFDFEDGVQQPWLGLVDRFILFRAKPGKGDGVRVEDEGDEDEKVIRLAVLNLWRVKPECVKFDDELYIVDNRERWRPEDEEPCEYIMPRHYTSLYPVLLSNIDHKVCLARPGGVDPLIYALKPHNVSRRF